MFNKLKCFILFILFLCYSFCYSQIKVATLSGPSSVPFAFFTEKIDSEQLQIPNYEKEAEIIAQAGKFGAVTIATGTSNGSIKVGDADVAVKGLRSAAFTERTDYASAIEFQGLSTLVGTSNNGTNTGIFKIIEDNEKVTANALTDLDTRLQAVNALLEWAEF